MTKDLESGAKIKYRKKNGNGKWETGTVHGVRYVDSVEGPVLLCYIIDTGKENQHAKGFKDRQPEQIDIRPSDVKAI